MVVLFLWLNSSKVSVSGNLRFIVEGCSVCILIKSKKKPFAAANGFLYIFKSKFMLVDPEQMMETNLMQYLRQ